jgi:regulator of protease activity HflC (stomatin/prohibitin superfamily)
VPSVSRHSARFGALAVCGLLLTGAATGCSTTQEKAEKQQAQSKHILEARAERQKQKADGPKSRAMADKSAHRPQEDGQ